MDVTLEVDRFKYNKVSVHLTKICSCKEVVARGYVRVVHSSGRSQVMFDFWVVTFLGCHVVY